MHTKQTVSGHQRWFTPSYWLYCIFKVVGSTLARLPRKALFMLGKGLGRIAYHTARKPRKIVSQNLQRCFPEANTQWHVQMTKSYFQQLGIGLMEFIIALWWSDEKLNLSLNIEGVEHIESARRQGLGVILLSGHFTTLELTIRLLCEYDRTIEGVYRQLKNPWINQFIYQCRLRRSGQIIERSETRRLIRALKQGAVIFYLPDMDMGKKFDAVFAPFFGVPVATVTATSKLAKITGAVVLPVSYYRNDHDNSYHLHVEPAITPFPTDDILADTTTINQALESIIRETPTQYFWHQKRFRRQPPCQLS